MTKQRLFDPVAPEEKLNEYFAKMRTARTSEAARSMLESIFEGFEDSDGNFVEQFQTTGFDARFLEIYLYAYFSRSGYKVDRSYPYPDFIVESESFKVAVEATTVNPSTSGVIAKYGKKVEDLGSDELVDYARNELPLRFGSALFSKLNKAYWKNAHCADIPFVIAIEAFHDDHALHFSDSAVTEYAYGVHHTANWGKDGELLISAEGIAAHTLREKSVPSGFFNQPDTENISAILFTNSGTHAKLSRMGYQSGFGNDHLKIKRLGSAYDPNPDAMDGVLFSYDMDDPPLVEPWGQGLVVIHSPNAKWPLPPSYFKDAKESFFLDGHVLSSPGGWHPFRSNTLVLDVGELKSAPGASMMLGHGPRVVAAIDKVIFWAHEPQIDIDGREEDGWFADEFESFLGLILREGESWVSIVLGRDNFGKFISLARSKDISSRLEAVDLLQHKMMAFLSKPRRLFDGPTG